MAPREKATETTKFQIELQDRLLKVVDDHAADVLMTPAKYLPAVIRGYQMGKHRLVRPEPGEVAKLSKPRKGQKFKSSRFSALYPVDTTAWLDELAERAGGFNRSHTVVYLLLDWFRINPFVEVFDLKHGGLAKKGDAISANTSMTNRIRTSFTCQKRMMDIIKKAGDPTPEQQYIRTVLASYARGQERAFRPKEGSVPKLKNTKSGADKTTMGFYFSPELLAWVDDLGERAGGFSRSHVTLLLLLDWLQIDPFQ